MAREEVYTRKDKKLNYNAITATHYDDQKEKHFVQERKEKQKTHGNEYNRRFPPAWKYKEMLIID